MDENYHGTDDNNVLNIDQTPWFLDDSFFESVSEIINEANASAQAEQAQVTNVSFKDPESLLPFTIIEGCPTASNEQIAAPLTDVNEQIDQQHMSNLSAPEPESLWPDDLVDHFDPANGQYLSGLENTNGHQDVEDNLICTTDNSAGELVLSEDSATYINGPRVQYLSGLENPNSHQDPKDNTTCLIGDSNDNLVLSEDFAVHINGQSANVPFTSFEECPTGSNDQIAGQLPDFKEQIDEQLTAFNEQMNTQLTGPNDLEGITQHTHLSFVNTSENSFPNLGLNDGATDYFIGQQESEHCNSEDIIDVETVLDDPLLSTQSAVTFNSFANVGNETSTNALGTDEQLFLINIPIDDEGNLDFSGFSSDFVNSLLNTANRNKTGDYIDNEKSKDGAHDACLETLSNTMTTLQSDSGVDINSLQLQELPLNPPSETNQTRSVLEPCKQSFEAVSTNEIWTSPPVISMGPQFVNIPKYKTRATPAIPKRYLQKAKIAKKQTKPIAAKPKKASAGRKKNDVLLNRKNPEPPLIVRCYPIKFKTVKSVKEASQKQCIIHNTTQKAPTGYPRIPSDTSFKTTPTSSHYLLEPNFNKEFTGTVTTCYDDYIEDENCPILNKIFKSKKKPEEAGDANKIQGIASKVQGSTVTLKRKPSPFITVRNGVLAPRRRKQQLRFESDSDDSDSELLHAKLNKAKSFRCKNCMKPFMCGRSMIRHTKRCTILLSPKK